MRRTAFSYFGTKEAALYFDDVIPLFLLLDGAFEYGFDELAKLTGVDYQEAIFEKLASFRALLPSELTTLPNSESYAKLNIDILREMGAFSEFREVDRVTPILEILRKRQVEVDRLIQSFVSVTQILIPSFSTVDSVVSNQSVDANDDIRVALLQLNLVDVDKTPIEKIVKFREDKDSQSKLRQLRLFAQANYTGKSLSYIEDDIEYRIDMYDDVVKKWDFETIYSGVATLFNSKTAIGALGGTIAAVLAGSPILAGSAAVLGTTLGPGLFTATRRLRQRCTGLQGRI